jgi:N-methylhydantoinase B
MTVIFPLDGHHHPPKGVRGGYPGAAAYAAKIDREGAERRVPCVSAEKLLPGEFIVGADTGGGGYGDPLERDPERVRFDVLERWVSMEQAREVYGVVFTGHVDDESLAVDAEGTAKLRRVRGRGSG